MVRGVRKWTVRILGTNRVLDHGQGELLPIVGILNTVIIYSLISILIYCRDELCDARERVYVHSWYVAFMIYV
jgi:hypothetical protein